MLLFTCSVVSDSLQPPGLQHARLPCPSLSPEVLLKLMSTESMMPSNHFILCHPLLLLPSILPNIWSQLFASCGQSWRFSFSVSPSSGYSGLISYRIEWFEYCVKQLLFSWVCWIKHRLLLCDLACLHSSWHSLVDFVWTLPRILVLEFDNKAHCKWLPGPQCASFQALVSIASCRARPHSKCRGVEAVLFLCKVSVRIANLLFWNMMDSHFVVCGVCQWWSRGARVALKISKWENLWLLEHL